MPDKLTWEQYQAQFPRPYDLAQYIGRPLSEYPDNYDEMRKANMKWEAKYITEHADYIDPMMLLNPFVRGGWYYGLKSTEYIPDPNPQVPVDWQAEADAGRPVVGPAVPARSTPLAESKPAADNAEQQTYRSRLLESVRAARAAWRKSKRQS